MTVSSSPCLKQQLLDQVCAVMRVDQGDVRGTSRVAQLVRARYLFAFVARARWPEMSYPRIGRMLGGRDHSTVLSGLRMFDRLMEREPALRLIAEQLIAQSPAVDHAAHVSDWLAYRQANARAVALASSPERLAVAQGRIEDAVSFIQQGRRVRAHNALANDDYDALRRKVGADALGAAIAAAGGWR